MGHIQPWGWRLHTPWQAEKAIHQLMLNRLMSTASICPYCGLEVESRQLNIYFFSAQKWATECQPYFNNSRDKSDVIQNSDNLVEFLTALGHLPPPPYKQSAGLVTTTTTTTTTATKLHTTSTKQDCTDRTNSWISNKPFTIFHMNRCWSLSTRFPAALLQHTTVNRLTS